MDISQIEILRRVIPQQAQDFREYVSQGVNTDACAGYVARDIRERVKGITAIADKIPDDSCEDVSAALGCISATRLRNGYLLDLAYTVVEEKRVFVIYAHNPDGTDAPILGEGKEKQSRQVLKEPGLSGLVKVFAAAADLPDVAG